MNNGRDPEPDAPAPMAPKLAEGNERTGSPGGDVDRDQAKERLTGTAQQTAEQITERAQTAIDNYFNWLQKTMSAFPLSNTDLNRKLFSYATENITAAFGLVQRLSEAKNFEDIFKIQSEFMNTQLHSFNEQAKKLGEIYTEAAEAPTKVGR